MLAIVAGIGCDGSRSSPASVDSGRADVIRLDDDASRPDDGSLMDASAHDASELADAGSDAADGDTLADDAGDSSRSDAAPTETCDIECQPLSPGVMCTALFGYPVRDSCVDIDNPIVFGCYEGTISGTLVTRCYQYETDDGMIGEIRVPTNWFDWAVFPGVTFRPCDRMRETEVTHLPVCE